MAETTEAVQEVAVSSAPLTTTGRRKRSIARVRLVPGLGTILVNERPYDAYFPREAL